MSRFVAEGAADQPTPVNDKWAEAEQIIKNSQGKPKVEVGRQQDGKSLYEVLQANKAAKQEAFEEATKLKNQFPALDEDDADFLDSILETTRSKDALVRSETLAQLEAFRKRQADIEKQQNTPDDAEPDTSLVNEWAIRGHKRKKPPTRDKLMGLKSRKASSDDPATRRSGNDNGHEQKPQDVSHSHSTPKRPRESKGPLKEASSERKVSAQDNIGCIASGLGLTAYGSSDED